MLKCSQMILPERRQPVCGLIRSFGWWPSWRLSPWKQLWFAIGAAAAMFASFFTSSLGIQAAVFAVVSAVALAIMVPTLTRHRKEHKPPVTNGSPLTIGKQGIVLVAIEPGMPGRVRVDGLDWQARAEVAIPQGARICVADVDGAVLLVTPVTEATSVE